MAVDVKARLSRSLVSLIGGLIMTLLGYLFFSASVALLSQDPPKASAGLMAGLAGFTFTAGAVTLLRDWLILERACSEDSKEGEVG